MCQVDQTVCYMRFVVNSYWGELDIMSGSTGVDCSIWILFTSWRKHQGGETDVLC